MVLSWSPFSFGWLILDTFVVTDPIKTLFGLLVKDTMICYMSWSHLVRVGI